MRDVTVGELIEQLGRLDPGLPVYVRGYEGGVDDVTRLNEVQVLRDHNTAEYYGAHYVFDPEYDEPDEHLTPGVCIG